MVNSNKKEKEWESVLSQKIYTLVNLSFAQENGETVYGGELSEQLTEEIKQQWIAEGN